MVLSLPDGSRVRIQPGPYGRGISVTPLAGGAAATVSKQGKGRPPRPSTLELRARLQQDAASGHLRRAREYVDWVAQRDPKASRQGLQQTVYRELRGVGGTRGKRGRRGRGARAPVKGGPRGRAPHPATVALRERLDKDKVAGALHDAAYYLRWVVEKSDIGLKKARPIVYRELRART
jgi:hypothetical protein